MLLQCKGKDSNTHKGTPMCNRTDMAEEMAPAHPSVRTYLGSTDQEILDIVEWVYRRQYEVVPSVLPCRFQDQSMAKLHEEIDKHLVWASLQSAMATALSLSRGRRHL